MDLFIISAFLAIVTPLCQSQVLPKPVTSPAAPTISNASPAGPKSKLFKIEGKASVGRDVLIYDRPKWRTDARVLVNYGHEDGSFSVSGVPAGSYIVEIAHRDYIFEPVRVDIARSGKARARRLNLLDPKFVQQQQLVYPLRLAARQRANYFRAREQWRITDMLLSPMVLMMVLPLLFLIVLPKLVNTRDPEVQRELQSMMMPKYEMPDASDIMAQWFGGSGGSNSAKKGPKRPQPITAGDVPGGSRDTKSRGDDKKKNR